MRPWAALSLSNAYISKEAAVVASLALIDGCGPDKQTSTTIGHRNLRKHFKFKRILSRAKAEDPGSPSSHPHLTAVDSIPTTHTTPEDYTRVVKMDSRPFETAPDEQPTQPVTPSAPSVDALWETSPSITVSPDRPLGAGSRIISEYRDVYQHDSMSSFRPETRSYELEANVPSIDLANHLAARPTGRVSQGHRDRPHAVDKGLAGGIPSLSAVRPMPPRDVGATPATAIHCPMALGVTKNKRRSTDKQIGDDPFLGTGRLMRRSSISSTTMRTPDNTLSPSPSRLRSSQLGNSPGLLSLHDVHDEVLSILDTLKTTHRNQTKKEVDAALMRCQEDLKGRAKDKNTGTAESNILDREAARISRARDEAYKQVAEAGGASSPGEGAVYQENLRLALTRLMDDARAALDAVAQAKSQAASASRATNRYIPYRVGEDFQLTALNFENRTLREKVKRLEAEKEQAEKEKSDLQSRLDELMAEVKARRREQPLGASFGPWGKEWNMDSRRDE